MKSATVNELFLDSVERCARPKKFIPVFYSRFLPSSEDKSDKFRNTDFERQHRMLLRPLKLAAHAADGQPEGLWEIRERAVSHNIETSRQIDE